MCTVLLPPGVNPIAVNKYIIMYHRKVKNGSVKNCFYVRVGGGVDLIGLAWDVDKWRAFANTDGN